MRMTEQEYAALMEKREKGKNKYNSSKTRVDGIEFDSRKEANRYCELKILQKAGLISELKLQVPFELLPTQKDENGKVIERKCSYIADFSYLNKDGKRIVEDVKSTATRTKDYKIKRKLMLYIHGIQVEEI